MTMQMNRQTRRQLQRHGKTFQLHRAEYLLRERVALGREFAQMLGMDTSDEKTAVYASWREKDRANVVACMELLEQIVGAA